MQVKWLGFIAFVWVILLLMAATFDGQSSAAHTWGPENETQLEYLTDIRRVVYADNETGSFAWVTPNTQYFDAFVNVVTWDFSFLKCADTSPGCGYEYFRLIVLTPITIAAIFGIIYMFLQLIWGFLGRFG